MLNIIFYTPLMNRPDEFIKNAVSKAALRAKSEIVRDKVEIINRINTNGHNAAIIVLYAHNEGAFLNIVSIRRFLSDNTFILILPDQHEITTSIGHALRPRVLTYAGGSSADVEDLLGRMIENYNKRISESNEAMVFSDDPSAGTGAG